MIVRRAKAGGRYWALINLAQCSGNSWLVSLEEAKAGGALEHLLGWVDRKAH